MFKKILLVVIFLVFLVGLVYVILPGAKDVEYFSPIPNSKRSELDGDTWQNPNLKAYFADVDRAYITNFYREQFEKSLIPGIRIPSIRINRPPEEAYRYVRDQQESTFLEEYVFPFRESIFVNGYEPVIENMMFNKQRSYDGDHIIYQGVHYDAKATLRYYPSDWVVRVGVYLLLGMSLIATYKITIRVIKD